MAFQLADCLLGFLRDGTTQPSHQCLIALKGPSSLYQINYFIWKCQEAFLFKMILVLHTFCLPWLASMIHSSRIRVISKTCLQRFEDRWLDRYLLSFTASSHFDQRISYLIYLQRKKGLKVHPNILGQVML